MKDLLCIFLIKLQAMSLTPVVFLAGMSAHIDTPSLIMGIYMHKDLSKRRRRI